MLRTSPSPSRADGSDAPRHPRPADDRPRGARRRSDDEAGFIVVPVMVLLAIGLLLAFAALILVDRQTEAAQAQRTTDAAQTLSEGVLSAAAGVLASDPGGSEWNRAAAQACTKVSGDLNGKRTGAAGSFEQAVQVAVDGYFKAAKAGEDALSDYDTRGGSSTRWRLEVCPTAADPTTDVRWEDASHEARVGATGATGGLKQLWVRAQADVRPKTSSTGTLSDLNSRAVAAKVQQDGKSFAPPEDYGVGTGSFSTDVGTNLPNVLTGLTQESPVLGNALGTILGTNKNPIIADKDAKIGVRCGVANALDGKNANGPLDLNLCLGGVLSGVNGVTSLVGLNGLLSTVGVNTNRFATLAGLRMAPAAAIAAYRSASQTATGVYRSSTDSPTGVGDVKSPPAGSVHVAATAPCLTTTQTAKLAAQPDPSQSVVFIEQVGTGDQYCSIPANSKAKIFVVNRGGVVVNSKFTGVVYALNANELEGSSRIKRELVRIEAPGQVVGSAWVDGVKGQVGTYPGSADSAANTFTTNAPAAVTALTSPLDDTLCAISRSDGLLGAVLGPIVQIVGNLLNVVLQIGPNTQRWVLPTAAGAPAAGADPPVQEGQACGVIKGALGALTGTNTIYSGTEHDTTVPTTTWKRTSTCIKVLGLGSCSPWTVWSRETTGSQDVMLSAGLLNNLLGASNLLSGLVTGLGDAFRDTPSAIVRDTAVIRNAKVTLPDNAALVSGSFRTLPPAAPGL